MDWWDIDMEKKNRSNPKEHAAEKTDALLAEYAAIKSEEIACEQAQVAIVTSVFTFISAIIGLNYFFGNDPNAAGPVLPINPQYMLLGFCPILVMFFGCLSMYQLYCHMRFGAYLYHLEEDINKTYSQKWNWIYFEHWIAAQESCASFFLEKPSYLYGCIMSGTWITAPFLLCGFTSGFFPDWSIVEFYCNHKCLLLFLVFVLLVYYFVQVMYLRAILKIKGKTLLSKPRIS